MDLSQKDSAEESQNSSQSSLLQISDLPEEILEYILIHLSPYRDLKCAMAVNRQWYRLVQGVIRQMYQNFYAGILEGQLAWTGITPEVGSNITERYSHCACYYDKSMYIFGGCTSTNTTFNDLWRFDLKDRQWIRPLAIGTYPSPKACASLVVYKDSLVLFGGWSHPTPYPLHQAARFFSELHIYKPEQNRSLCRGGWMSNLMWSATTCTSCPTHKSPYDPSHNSAPVLYRLICPLWSPCVFNC